MHCFFKETSCEKFCARRTAYLTTHIVGTILMGIVGTVLMDLSKAYECIPHDLLIAELEAYGFHRKALRLSYSYLSNRIQRVKIGSTYSSPIRSSICVPQGSVLGPLLFNVFINDLFYRDLASEICNFADDTTIYSCDANIDSVIIKLERDLQELLEWYTANGMSANPSGFQIVFFGLKRKNKLCLNVNGQLIPPSDHVKLLWVTYSATNPTFDYLLNFGPTLIQPKV